MFRINEIYTSIHGEGAYTGTPAHFIRFQGCPHACQFCDARKTWIAAEAPLELSLDDLMGRFSILTREYPKIHHIILTGGEPLFGENGKHLSKFIKAIWEKYQIPCHIETSGMEYPVNFREDLQGVPVFVTANIKRKDGYAFYQEPKEQLIPLIFEYKLLVDDETDCREKVEFFVKRYSKDSRTLPYVYLQPMEYLGDAAKTRSCMKKAIQMSLDTGLPLSAQLHKLLFID